MAHVIAGIDEIEIVERDRTIPDQPPNSTINSERSQTNKELEGLNATKEMPFMEPINESISLNDINPSHLIQNISTISNSEDIYNKAPVIPTVNGSNDSDKNKAPVIPTVNGNNFIINGYDSLEFIKEIQEIKIKITITTDQKTIMNAIKALNVAQKEEKYDNNDMNEKIIEQFKREVTLSDDMYEMLHTTQNGETVMDDDDDAQKSLIELENDSLSDGMYDNIAMAVHTKNGTGSNDIYKQNQNQIEKRVQVQTVVMNNNLGINDNIYKQPYVQNVQSVRVQMSDTHFDTTMQMKSQSSFMSDNESTQFFNGNGEDKIYTVLCQVFIL